MYHYIYKITDTLTGEYYIGKRSSIKEPETDSYFGSGNWIKRNKQLIKTHKGRFVKEVMEYCGSEGEAYSRESFWIDHGTLLDPKCMNENVGGIIPPKLVGEDNKAYDKRLHHIFNVVSGIEYRATQRQIKEMLPALRQHVSSFVNGRIASLGDFVLYANKDMPVGYDRIRGSNSAKYDHTVYHFYNKKTGESHFLTQRQAIERLKLNRTNVNGLIHGKLYSVRDFVLYENKDTLSGGDRVSDLTKYRLWDHRNGVEVFMTQKEMKARGMDPTTVNKLVRGKALSCAGYTLYSNKDKRIRIFNMNN